MTDLYGSENYCSHCHNLKTIRCVITIPTYDIHYGRTAHSNVLLCEECYHGICYCDICFKQTTYKSYKDHINEHTKEELMDVLVQVKFHAERNIREF